MAGCSVDLMRGVRCSEMASLILVLDFNHLSYGAGANGDSDKGSDRVEISPGGRDRIICTNGVSKMFTWKV